MIDAQRLQALNSILSNLAGTAPAALWTFYHNCTTQGFRPEQAQALTVAMLQSVLAVPSPVEASSSAGNAP